MHAFTYARPIHAVVLNGKNSARAGAEQAAVWYSRNAKKVGLCMGNYNKHKHTAGADPPTYPTCCQMQYSRGHHRAPRWKFCERERREAASSSSSFFLLLGVGAQTECVCEWSASSPVSIHITHSAWIRAKSAHTLATCDIRALL